jgi:hypothetical protein
MKKLVLFLLLFPFTSFAQKFNAGIRAGLVASQVDGDTYEGFDKAGVTAGLYVNRSFSDKFSLQLEMNYIQKGSRMPVDDLNNYYLMRLTYVEVPLLLQWHVSNSFTLFGGPSYGVLVSSYEENQLGELTNMPAFKKYEIAARVGLAYKLSEKWNVDIRYCGSMATVRPSPAGYAPSYFEKGQFNRLVEIGLAVGF